MSKNVYWEDALASGTRITLKNVGAGSIYKCGKATVFWHGQESLAAQEALDEAVTKGTAPNEPCPKCGITPFPACGCVGGFF